MYDVIKCSEEKCAGWNKNEMYCSIYEQEAYHGYCCLKSNDPNVLKTKKQVIENWLEGKGQNE